MNDMTEYEDVSIVGEDAGISVPVFLSSTILRRLAEVDRVAGIVDLDSIVRGLASALMSGKRAYWCTLHTYGGGLRLAWLKVEARTVKHGPAWFVTLAGDKV